MIDKWPSVMACTPSRVNSTLEEPTMIFDQAVLGYFVY